MPNDPAILELVRQAEAHAKLLEQPVKGGKVCDSHDDLARGVSLALRLLAVVYRKNLTNNAWAWATGIGIPTPVCLFVWLIGTSKGWW